MAIPAFSNIHGQELALRELTNLLERSEGGRFLLFQGPRGVGKGTLARCFSRALLCEKRENSTLCGICLACSGKAHPDLLISEPEKEGEHIGIETIREIQAILYYPPFRGKFRVWILDSLEDLTLQAQEALLRTLEEPPQSLWILGITHAYQRLPLTLRSRALRIPCTFLSPKELFAIDPHLPGDLASLGSLYRVEELKQAFPTLKRIFQKLLEMEPYDPQEAAQFARRCEGFPGGMAGFLKTVLLLHSAIGPPHPSYREKLHRWIAEAATILTALTDLELHVNPAFVSESLIRELRRIRKSRKETGFATPPSRKQGLSE